MRMDLSPTGQWQVPIHKTKNTPEEDSFMRLKTRVLIIVLASLFGLVVMGIFGLLTTK